GVKLPGVDYVRPPTPPPDLDLEAWSDSITLIRSLRPDILYLGHFGAIKEVPQHLGILREKLLAWGDFILETMRSGKNEAEIIALAMKRTKPNPHQLNGTPKPLKSKKSESISPITCQAKRPT